MAGKNPQIKLADAIGANKSTASSQELYLYQEIFDAILAQHLLPGTKLPEDELAKIFGVSRTVVRRALLRLSHSHIIESQPNRGAFVASPSIKQAREIFAARRIIEAAIVREAVVCASKKDLEDLRMLVHEEQDLFKNDKRGSGIRLSGDFHLKLAVASQNSTLLEFMKVLIPQTSLIIAQYEKPGYTNCSHEEHFALHDVIASGDVERAAALMDEHLLHIQDKLNLEDSADKNDLSRVFANVVKSQSLESV